MRPCTRRMNPMLNKELRTDPRFACAHDVRCRPPRFSVEDFLPLFGNLFARSSPRKRVVGQFDDRRQLSKTEIGAGRPSRRKSPKGGSGCQGLRLLVLQDGPLSIISSIANKARAKFVCLIQTGPLPARVCADSRHAGGGPAKGAIAKFVYVSESTLRQFLARVRAGLHAAGAE